MKKIILSAAILFMAASTQAQLGGLVDKATKTAAAAGLDVNKLTSGIMGKLGPSLKLSSAQQTQVTDIVSGFLTKKSDIVPLAGSNPTEYAKKQSGLFSGLQSKLGGALSKDQMTKFNALKPAKASSSDPLSALFY
ncbi:MAG: hypothetical protein WCP74_09445 [Sphingobacteriia bacterium]|jgi:hypothetical protein